MQQRSQSETGRMTLCREAALRRREERKRKREREEIAAAEKAEADRAAAEKAAAEKKGTEPAVKEETGIPEVKEEGSNVDAPVAAEAPPSMVPNGDNVSASMLSYSSQLVSIRGRQPGMHYSILLRDASCMQCQCAALRQSNIPALRIVCALGPTHGGPCAGCSYGGGRGCRGGRRQCAGST